jgi:hypothetical protein
MMLSERLKRVDDRLTSTLQDLGKAQAQVGGSSMSSSSSSSSSRTCLDNWAMLEIFEMQTCPHIICDIDHKE